jgi:hypothetical protein
MAKARFSAALAEKGSAAKSAAERARGRFIMVVSVSQSHRIRVAW